MPDHLTGTLDGQNYCMEWNSTKSVGSDDPLDKLSADVLATANANLSKREVFPPQFHRPPRGPVGWMAKFGYNAGSYVEGKGCPAKYGKDITKSFVKAHSKDFDSKVVR
eukprot:gene6825-14598_t